jgi:hypothetical protein
MHPCLRITAAFALVLSLGLHWAVLQTVAWTGMIVKYSRNGSFTEAVSKTFDGKHPCAMCKVIEQGRAEEKKQEQKQVKPGSKLDPGLIWQPVTFDFTCARKRIPTADAQASSRTEQPPKPRPRPAFSDQPA